MMFRGKFSLSVLETEIMGQLCSEMQKHPYRCHLSSDDITGKIQNASLQEVSRSLYSLYKLKLVDCIFPDPEKPGPCRPSLEGYLVYLNSIGKWDDEWREMLDLLSQISTMKIKPDIDWIEKDIKAITDAHSLNYERTYFLVYLLSSFGFIEVTLQQGEPVGIIVHKISGTGEQKLRELEYERNIHQRFSFVAGTSPEVEKILAREYETYRNFKTTQNWKYATIAAGAILESLIQYYVESHTSCPFTLKDTTGKTSKKPVEKTFERLLSDALKFNLFNQNRNWRFIQDHLRDFRNYVHIRKEIKENFAVDQKLFGGIEPIFEEMLNIFKQNW